MEKWEITAKKFIDSCKFKDDIEAVFLTGSHAFGNADEFSDIDLFVILSEATTWRERGNKRLDGLLIEYFANPPQQVKKYIDDNYASVDLTEINMLLGGIVIFNKNSAAEKILDYCHKKLTQVFPKMSEFNIKTGLYNMWDSHDELCRAYSNKTPDFTAKFFSFMRHAFELYSKYVGSPVPSHHKLYTWLTDENYFNKYGLPPHNDPNFIGLMKSAFECKDTHTMFNLSKTAYAYVTDKMGGFDIDNFAMRGPCD